MSEYAQDEDSPQHHPGRDTPTHNISSEDPSNNSIIGNIKSRVSSILPNRLSKWFSPSSSKLQNDSLNGSISTPLSARRRRRIDVEGENYEDDLRQEGNEQDLHRDPDDDEEENDYEDEDSQNSDEEYVVGGVIKGTKSNLSIEQQPPAKRSRLSTDVGESPLITRRQPILSSTPALSNSYLRSAPGTSTPGSRSSYQRLTNLNLYSNQVRKEPAYNFNQQKELKSTKVNTDIIDLISNPSLSTNAFGDNQPIISSRKSLKIAPSASVLPVDDHVYSTASSLKRQPLSTAPTDLFKIYAAAEPLRRTSTVILERKDDNEQDQCRVVSEKPMDGNTNIYNGRIEESNNNYAGNKRAKLINGNGFSSCPSVIPESNDTILLDSASESGESATEVTKANSSNIQPRSGLFNMSASGSVNTRNSSRTSSFGNGLNFYSHLEGRKSLFSGTNNNNNNNINPLNNSTLSLTSLNRRQFNASIYGSTSALSDSRLLNTFSPFYKGKTTYGGAAAYNKFLAGSGSNTVRITPTLIRPTSSLSNLSSSSNSLANNINSQVCENSSISTTAKRILDLINDFATPLSEAKKMANSLKSNPSIQIPLQARGRLNDNDLNASRAMRLSQVRSPYSRPAVILQPSGNASGRGTIGGLLPPVKELQVPTMSQLLQMKKIQNTTEKVRKITQNSVTNNIGACEYSLPDGISGKANSNSGVEPEKQKHTNKIKSKVTNSLRPSATSKDIQDEEPPPPVILPNIAFPLMQSIPKIDIQINKTPLACSSSTSQSSNTLTQSSNKDSTTVLAKTTSFAFNPPTTNKNVTEALTVTKDSGKIPTISIQPTSLESSTSLTSKSKHTFTFSKPIEIGCATTAQTQSITMNDMNNYKFSQPLDATISKSICNAATQNTLSKQTQFKEGSCLDALNKPLLLPTTTSTTTSQSNTPTVISGFGGQFKKSANEWECDVCMIRNKSDVNKCVACETQRSQSSSAQVTGSASSLKPSFGLQFTKSFDEWECDTCLIRNKHENTKCVACETVRKGDTKLSSVLPPIKSSFGDAFKPKLGNWECPTCMISNKNDVNECIACQTKKPGASSVSHAVTSSSVPQSQFKFGFGNATSSADEGFKTLAAEQKASKWECDACMTRNDSHRTKCACCEQPKPGISSAETTNSTSTKFQFGATAAGKFSFGFGASVNTPIENNNKSELANKNDTPKPSATIFGIENTQQVSTQKGFQFGIKSSASNSSESKKDETDNKNQTGFIFGVNSADKTKACEAPVAAQPSFTFGSKQLTEKATSSPPSITTFTQATTTSSAATTSSSNTFAVSASSVKFSLPSASTNILVSNDKPTGVAVPTLNFGTSTTTSTSGGFSFINTSQTKPSATTGEKKLLDNFAFKAPTTTASAVTTKNTGFIFGSSTTNSSSTGTTVCSTTTTTAITSSTATAAVKPMFSLSSNTSTGPQPQSSQTSSGFGGFTFGSNSTISNAGSTLFTTVTSTSTATTTSPTNATTSLSTTSMTTTTTPASTNIFGSFGGSSNNSSTPLFGSSINTPANTNISTVSSSTNNSTVSNVMQFGAFATKSTPNVFGTFGSKSGAEGIKSSSSTISTETKPTLSVFGNVAPTSTSQSNSGGFVFGSKPSATNTPLVSTTLTTSSVTSTSTTWPKNNFVFGSTTTATSLAPNESKDGTKELTKPSLFGSFSSSSSVPTNQQQISSIFGTPASNIASPSSGSSATLASGPTISSTNLFGTQSTSASTNIFGASSSGNAVTPAPNFGSSPFGGAASSTRATPTFGSTAASGSTTFGGFGGASSSNSTTNTTEIKKPETAFNFGSSLATQSTSGGFNFGSTSTTKPAFNFGSPSTTQQPTFNFTGSSETQSSTKPFQFGATPSAPVFNFNPGALEGTPNAPFQFNAGPAPVSSNIFAPAPTAGAQSAQQVKRKYRAPTRRVTQR